MRIATPKDLGALAQAARRAAGLTQSQLGVQIGASRFWVAQFERGKSGAELGLALKALRALGLVVSIEPQHVRAGSQVQGSAPGAYPESPRSQPNIDLSAIVDRSALGTTGRTDS
jgi:DNA-binding XRE family transcriptional regulator